VLAERDPRRLAARFEGEIEYGGVVVGGDETSARIGSSMREGEREGGRERGGESKREERARETEEEREKRRNLVSTNDQACPMSSVHVQCPCPVSMSSVHV
jgi:hypothetical protein